MNNWRIYRLPGSRENWHIDSGPCTEIYNVKKFDCLEGCKSVDIGGNNVPRAWLEVPGTVELHLINGEAVFGSSELLNEIREKFTAVTEQK